MRKNAYPFFIAQERCSCVIESDRLIEKHHSRYVIFDFRETNFMDSSGIGVIMGRYKRLYMMGGEVCAVHTSDRVKKILTMSGTAKIMHIYEEEQ